MVPLILALAQTLHTVALPVCFYGVSNQNINPRSLLVDGVDVFSRAINHLSINLTTLAISMYSLTSDIFRLPETDSSGPGFALWPNLRILDIRTGIERADGRYWLRGPDSSTPVEQVHTTGSDDDLPSDYDADDEEHVWGKTLGSWPDHIYLVRPEPALFDELALNIARAVSHMPKLTYMNAEFMRDWKEYYPNARPETPDGLKEYMGWAFYFRASNDDRHTHASFEALNRPINRHAEPGPYYTEIERPRTEWVFQCPYLQVQWDEPEEAKALWKRKFPEMDMDLVTQGYDEEGIGKFWERRRNGELVDSDWCPAPW
jgi:hypothetical protein